MKSDINSIAELREEFKKIGTSAARIEKFMARLEGMFNQLNMITGGIASRRTPNMSGNGTVEHELRVVTVKAPATVKDRVLAIMRDSGVPMSPKEVVSEYERRGWPKPKDGKLYNSVYGSMSYLCNRLEVLENTDKGYLLSLKTLPASSDTAKAREGVRT